MAINIKSEREIQLMRESCKILAKVHDELGKFIKPGITTADINKYGDELIRSFGCVPNFLNYEGYPASICVSVNEEVVHGIPGKRVLKEGDIVSLDAGLIYKGYHSDAARTYAVGEVSEECRKLMEVTKQAFFEGIKMAKAGNHLFDISIGTRLHEEPQIPNFRQIKHGPRLMPGMTLAIEPMINMGRADVEWLEDDWTVVAEDGLPSAHYENTILITEGEPEILTLL